MDKITIRKMQPDCGLIIVKYKGYNDTIMKFVVDMLCYAAGIKMISSKELLFCIIQNLEKTIPSIIKNFRIRYRYTVRQCEHGLEQLKGKKVIKIINDPDKGMIVIVNPIFSLWTYNLRKGKYFTIDIDEFKKLYKPPYYGWNK